MSIAPSSPDDHQLAPVLVHRSTAPAAGPVIPVPIQVWKLPLWEDRTLQYGSCGGLVGPRTALVSLHTTLPAARSNLLPILYEAQVVSETQRNREEAWILPSRERLLPWTGGIASLGTARDGLRPHTACEAPSEGWCLHPRVAAVRGRWTRERMAMQPRPRLALPPLRCGRTRDEWQSSTGHFPVLTGTSVSIVSRRTSTKAGERAPWEQGACGGSIRPPADPCPDNHPPIQQSAHQPAPSSLPTMYKKPPCPPRPQPFLFPPSSPASLPTLVL